MKAADRSVSSTITVHVPLTFTARGNSKRIVSEMSGAPSPARFESALIKAIGRAYRWRKMIESGDYDSITELAKAEKVNQSYACRLLRLTLLGPEVVTAILNGGLSPAPTVNELMKPFPVIWAEQTRAFGIQAAATTR